MVPMHPQDKELLFYLVAFGLVFLIAFGVVGWRKTARRASECSRLLQKTQCLGEQKESLHYRLLGGVGGTGWPGWRRASDQEFSSETGFTSCGRTLEQLLGHGAEPFEVGTGAAFLRTQGLTRLQRLDGEGAEGDFRPCGLSGRQFSSDGFGSGEGGPFGGCRLGCCRFFRAGCRADRGI